MNLWRHITTQTQISSFFFFNDTATTEIYTLSLHDALPISIDRVRPGRIVQAGIAEGGAEREAASERDGLVGSGVHGGRDVRDGRRDRGRRARRPARVGDGERDRVGAVVGVAVTRLDPGARARVPE